MILFIVEVCMFKKIEKIQNKFSDVNIGSYPYLNKSGFGTVLVIRSTDENKVKSCKFELEKMIKNFEN